jgi:hypothetical protein
MRDIGDSAEKKKEIKTTSRLLGMEPTRHILEFGICFVTVVSNQV